MAISSGLSKSDRQFTPVNGRIIHIRLDYTFGFMSVVGVYSPTLRQLVGENSGTAIGGTVLGKRIFTSYKYKQSIDFAYYLKIRTRMFQKFVLRACTMLN